jgi:hypothetical protein
VTDTYYLDWDDIKHVAPGTLPPYGFRELVRGSGVAVPDPATNAMHSGWWKPNQMPAHPVDLAGMQIRPPGALGQAGFTELVPRSGVWIADPNWGSSLGAEYGAGNSVPEKPLDMGRVKFQQPGALLPYGYDELIPGSGVCLPVEDLPPRLGTHLSAQPSAITDNDESSTASKVFEVNYRQLEDYAQTHDLSADEIAKWVQADPGFPERFLATHGKVAYSTYLKIKAYADSRQVQGTIYAHRNASTAEALRNAVRVIDGVDTDNATRLA